MFKNMELTNEQHDIINSSGNIKINAVAGSGKTTTIIEYAKARPENSRILYLAFNKSVKLEAIRKFDEKGLYNVKVETAHSLAYKHVVFSNNYKVRPQGYKTHEITEILGLQASGEKLAEYIIANHINKFLTYYCNSNKQRVRELNYLDVVYENKAKQFVTNFYELIEKQTRILLDKMNKGEIEVTHDFYLKKFQLSNPRINFDYILFDEGQDASAAMLDVFFKQEATKVIVGDTHQQIYGWRYAINSLEQADFKTYNLSASFRFSPDIAALAKEVLKMKDHLFDYEPVEITGMGTSKEIKSKAVLGRTNMGLLVNAIEFVTDFHHNKSLYFEGNFNSYTYADDGASLYDVLNLYNNKKRLIRDTLISKMRDMNELKEYIDKTEDNQLGMMVEIVEEYGDEIPEIINEIKDRHVSNDEKEKAAMIFSTVHRCKGMEYDSIQIVDDFITEDKLEKIMNGKPEEINISKLNEEINLIYVAVTRTKNMLYIPEALVPKNFPPSNQIIIREEGYIDFKKIDDDYKYLKEKKKKVSKPGIVKEKAYTYAEKKVFPKPSDEPWTEEMDVELTKMFCEKISRKNMARQFGRTKNEVRARIKELELEETYG